MGLAFSKSKPSKLISDAPTRFAGRLTCVTGSASLKHLFSGLRIGGGRVPRRSVWVSPAYGVGVRATGWHSCRRQSPRSLRSGSVDGVRGDERRHERLRVLKQHIGLYAVRVSNRMPLGERHLAAKRSRSMWSLMSGAASSRTAKSVVRESDDRTRIS